MSTRGVFWILFTLVLAAFWSVIIIWSFRAYENAYHCADQFTTGQAEEICQ